MFICLIYILYSCLGYRDKVQTVNSSDTDKGIKVSMISGRVESWKHSDI